MKKVNAENTLKTLPDFLKNAIGYFKDDLAKNTEAALTNASGTAGVIIKLFGQGAIDRYYQHKTAAKLDDFGLKAYLTAGFSQAKKSLENIEDKLPTEDKLKTEAIISLTAQSLQSQLDKFDPNKTLVIFQPKYHPAVQLAKNSYIQILTNIPCNKSTIDAFKLDFNNNIDARVVETFADDYDQHLKQTEQYLLAQNETKLLFDMVKLGRIGLQKDEDLHYEPTFASWQPVHLLGNKNHSQNHHQGINRLKKIEQKLQPIETLVTEYFDQQPDNHLNKLLFVVANFGKGKSVFLRQLAAKLAKAYLTTGEGDFPVYLNLRDFENTDANSNLGVISDFLANQYQIDISDPAFKAKRYLFLIDSLDESGELNKTAIDKVIASVQRIQQLDKTKYCTNRIIITSRPIDDCLTQHLNSHQPYTIDNDEGRPIPYYIAIYGFKQAQFNHWLRTSLKNSQGLDTIKASGFVNELITAIHKDKDYNLHQQLLENQTLSISELRRPIFSYMIYQLIINQVDFQSIGKIGIYLSFLNLLTKEAKHINDVDYHINLEDEFRFRNILHATAALWMFKRHQNQQGALNKADICRVLLQGENHSQSDKAILELFEGQGVTDIQFLSHSYFGEKDNTLHFQHQSFAEILLAEYYLKVFICYGLDKQNKTEEARQKLILGNPTGQTIQFLQELLLLLKQSAVALKKNGKCPNDQVIIQKRKLLFPLMAALATDSQNTLFSNTLSMRWYEDNCHLGPNQSHYPQQALINWCIDQQALNKIISLAANIMESTTNYHIGQATTKTALYNNELLAINNGKLSELPPDMDRWLALLVGNTLYTDVDAQQFFNSKIQRVEHLFDLIRNWNYANQQSAPYWGDDLFMGIDMRHNEQTIDISNLDCSQINFSYSKWHNLQANRTDFSESRMTNMSLDKVSFYQAHFINSFEISFNSIHHCDFGFATVAHAMQLPGSLAGIYWHLRPDHKTYISTQNLRKHRLYNSLLFALIDYGLKHNLCKKKQISSWFVFESAALEQQFFDMLNDYLSDNA